MCGDERSMLYDLLLDCLRIIVSRKTRVAMVNSGCN